MILGAHDLGWFKAMRVTPATDGIGLLIVHVGKEDEVLTRADVERLRDLCEEALS